MNTKVWRIIGVLFSVIGLAFCILAIVKQGEQPLPILGLLFANLGIWTNVFVTQKSKKEEKQHG